MAKAAVRPHARPTRKRALLLYMAGDNDLSDAGLQDVEELCQEGAGDDLHIGVEIDTRGDHTGSIRYEISKAEYITAKKTRAYRTVIERLKEQDTGDPTSLLNFLNWGFERFPADQRIVVIGGHGTGFRRKERAIAHDETGSALDMPELAYVLRLAGCDENKIGILGFDACLMGMLEVANHLAPYAHIFVCSQETEPGDGWSYNKIAAFLKGPETLEQVGSKMADYYKWYYSHVKRREKITQSVIDLDQTDAAMAALSALGQAMEQAKISRQQINKVRRRCQSFEHEEYVDAIDFAKQLCAEKLGKEITQAARDFIASLRKAILKNCVAKQSAEVRNAHGLSIWFPAAKYSYLVNRSKYLALRGPAEHTGWIDYIDSHFGDLDEI